jgi:hypothetical protein
MSAAPQVMALPQPLREGATEQQVYLLLPCSGLDGGAGSAAGVLPDSAAARELAAAAAPAMSFWRADRATGAWEVWQLSCKHGQNPTLLPIAEWS